MTTLSTSAATVAPDPGGSGGPIVLLPCGDDRRDYDDSQPNNTENRPSATKEQQQ